MFYLIIIRDENGNQYFSLVSQEEMNRILEESENEIDVYEQDNDIDVIEENQEIYDDNGEKNTLDRFPAYITNFILRNDVIEQTTRSFSHLGYKLSSVN